MTDIWTPGFIDGPIKMGQLMAIFALGFLLAQSRLEKIWSAAPILLVFVASGAGMAYLAQFENWTPILLFAATAIVGAVVTLGLTAAMPFTFALTAAVATILGLASRPDGGRFPDQWLVLLVNLGGAIALPVLIALICRRLRTQTENAKATSIGIRIAASWDTAIAAMMVALIGTQVS